MQNEIIIKSHYTPTRQCEEKNLNKTEFMNKNSHSKSLITAKTERMSNASNHLGEYIGRYSNNEIVYSNKKDHMNDVSNNMNGSHKYHAKRRKYVKMYMLYNSI